MSNFMAPFGLLQKTSGMPRRSVVRGLTRITLSAMALCLADANASYAQSCPADLTALSSQIATPSLQARLSLPMTTIIANAGGVDQALARTQSALADVLARRAVAAANGRDTRALDDSILVFTRQIEALECIKG